MKERSQMGWTTGAWKLGIVPECLNSPGRAKRAQESARDQAEEPQAEPALGTMLSRSDVLLRRFWHGIVFAHAGGRLGYLANFRTRFRPDPSKALPLGVLF